MIVLYDLVFLFGCRYREICDYFYDCSTVGKGWRVFVTESVTLCQAVGVQQSVEWGGVSYTVTQGSTGLL